MKKLRSFFRTLYWAWKLLDFKTSGWPPKKTNPFLAEYYHIRQTLKSAIRAIK